MRYGSKHGPARKGRSLSLLLAGIVIGSVLLTPAGAHFTQNPKHLGLHAWRQVIKAKVFTRKQVNVRVPRVARGVTDSNTVLPGAGSASAETHVQVSITAPRRGFVTVMASANFENHFADNCTHATLCTAALYLTHVNTGTHSPGVRTTVPPGTEARATGTDIWVFPVTKGIQTFDLRVWRTGSSTGSIFARGSVMTATFSPFGSL